MDFSDNKPIYLHITDLVSERVIRGVWREGDRAQSVRELAVELQVNPNTVMRAYEALQADGILSPSRGIGYFVAEGAAAKALEMRRREFLEQELSAVFRKMDTLGITPAELETYYAKYKTENENK